MKMNDESLLNSAQVAEILGVRRNAITILANEKHKGYRPLFPKPIKVNRFCLLWKQQEIYEYLDYLSKDERYKASREKLLKLEGAKEPVCHDLTALLHRVRQGKEINLGKS